MARRLIVSIAAGVVALVLTYPVVCSGGEFEVVDRCENVMGLALPGFSYRAPEEGWKIYLAPLAATAAACFLVWRLTGRRRTAPRATSRS